MATALAILVWVVPPAPAFAQGTDAHYAAGVAAFGRGDYATAVTEMKASLAAQPSGNAALYLGNAYLKQGHLGAAKAALMQALAIEPGNPKREAILTLVKGIDARNAAKVKVTSTPPGATIYVDAEKRGDARGKSPITISVTPGRHEIIAVLDGHETEKREGDFKPGEHTTVDLALRPKGCDVALSAQAPGARASIDDVAPMDLPATVRVALGAHKVAFTADGFAPQELPLACDGTKPLTLEAALVAVTPVGRVKLPAQVPGTVIAVDGKVVSSEQVSNGLTLPVGRHEITFTVGKAPPVTQIIEVKADAEITVEPPPPPPPPPAPPAPPPSPSPPRAGFPAFGIYGGLQAGGNFTLVPWNLGTDTKGAYPTSSVTGGVRIGVQLFPRLAVEGEARWVGVPNRLDDGLGHGLATDFNVLFHILRGNWTPIVEGGAGSYEVLSSKLDADADLRLHVGAGLRGLINDWLVVRVDARDVITDGFDRSTGNNIEVLLGAEVFLRARDKQR